MADPTSNTGAIIGYVAGALAAIKTVSDFVGGRADKAVTSAKLLADLVARVGKLEDQLGAQRQQLGEPAVVKSRVDDLQRDSGQAEEEIEELKLWKARVEPLLDWVEKQRSQGRMSAVRVDTGGRGRRGGQDGTGGE